MTQSRADRWYHNVCFNVGRDAQLFPDAQVERQHGVTPDFVRYWGEKYRNPGFHAGELGGARNFIFTADGQVFAEALLWNEVRGNPYRTNTAFARALVGLGLPIDRKWVARVFKSWKYNTKNVKYKNILKFHINNIAYYVIYVTMIRTLPFLRLKYLDEARFVSKKLKRHRGVAAAGRELHGLIDPQDVALSYSVTLLTSLAEPFGIVVTNPTEGANSGVDHLETIADLMDAGHLVAGDVLVMDNAPKHVAQENHELMGVLLETMGVRLVLLPKYSPELNPCELVFAKVKRYLRDERGRAPFAQEIGIGFSRVTKAEIVRYMEKCLEHYFE
jgi:hypothetical protein